MLIFSMAFNDALKDPIKVTFDGPSKTIIENITNNSINTLDVETDIYSAWKRWVQQRDNAKFLSAFRVIGGDSITETVSVSGTYFLINGWRIRPSEENHTLNINGNLYVDGGGNPIIPTLTNVSVNVNYSTSSIVSTVISRASLTSQDKSDINLGIFQTISPMINTINTKFYNLSVSLTDSQIDLLKETIYNRMKPDFNIMKGLVQHNFRFTDQIYNSDGNIIQAKVRLFNNELDTQNNVNAIKEYDRTCLYDANKRVIEYYVLE